MNLVTNGNFATGDFTGWTCSGGEGCEWNIDSFGDFADPGTQPPGATNVASTGCVGAPCNDPSTGATFSQTLSTTPSQTYTLSFYYDAGPGSGEGTTELQVLWNGSPVPGGTIVNGAASTWVLYTFTVTATGSSTVLEFSGRQDPEDNAVTNISVIPGSAPLTPAPRSLVLTGIGLAGLALWSLRRKLAKA